MGTPNTFESEGINLNQFATGVKNVPAAGTAVQLQSQEVPDGYAIVMRPRPTTTGIIYYAFTKADAEDPTIAAQLGLGDFIGLYLVNTDLIWITSSVNGEGVTWAVEIK